MNNISYNHSCYTNYPGTPQNTTVEDMDEDKLLGLIDAKVAAQHETMTEPPVILGKECFPDFWFDLLPISIANRLYFVFQLEWPRFLSKLGMRPLMLNLMLLRSWKYVTVSAAAAELLGLTTMEMTGKRDWLMFIQTICQTALRWGVSLQLVKSTSCSSAGSWSFWQLDCSADSSRQFLVRQRMVRRLDQNINRGLRFQLPGGCLAGTWWPILDNLQLPRDSASR